ncbi:MAG: nicotinate-nucleotide adenylyltransferase, partial [Gammaproteobacteria bacterium]|nr:nicotinate-nucleotide adenylyltransferase [Gammaproteobacteria bacterium]
ARPPHRGEPDATDRQRLEMVMRAIDGEPRFILDDREYRREGESYMVDTLESLRQELGSEVSLLLIIGSDAFLGLTGWHRWQQLLALAHIVVVLRPGSELMFEKGAKPRDLELQKLYDMHHSTDLNDLKRSCGVIHSLETTALEISATEIRQMIAAGESPQFLLPETVLNYIDERNLYR